MGSNNAIKFIVLLGIVSLFGDMTYEAGRSLNGPYLAILSASATVVATITGLGELVGYGLRLVSGYISDKTQRYWLITIIGYGINLLAVPLMAFAFSWQYAAALIVFERLGKAIRTPARDVMLSHAGMKIGSGWAFGLHEAMDQIGAIAGPLLVGWILYLKSDYRAGYAMLCIPAILALACLLLARFLYPQPSNLSGVYSKVPVLCRRQMFWLYMASISLIAAGYVDFPLIAYHFKKTGIIEENTIPLLYAVAMSSDALSALIFGRIFDRVGLYVIIIGVFFSIFSAPMVFLGDIKFYFLGMILWGIGMGMQESVLRAAISTMIPSEKRGSAYGVFNMFYGFFWFAGSVFMGLMYDKSLNGLVAFSMSAQMASIFFLFFIINEKRSKKSI